MQSQSQDGCEEYHLLYVPQGPSQEEKQRNEDQKHWNEMHPQSHKIKFVWSK